MTAIFRSQEEFLSLGKLKKGAIKIMKEKVIAHPRSLRRRGSFPAKLFKVLVAVCILVALFLYLGQVMAYWKIKAELKELGSILATLREENERLREEIILLQDEEYIEMQARKNLGMVRPGETIFFVVD